VPKPAPDADAQPPPLDAESQWLADAQAGDREAYARIVEAYWDRLFRWLFHMTRDQHRAEDLTQETFLKALAGLKSFRVGTNFRAWLFRIAHNNFVNMKRTDRRATVPLPDDAPELHASSPEQCAVDREAVQVVLNALRELPADFRSAILLRAEEGLSFKEIAAIQKTTEETARWRVFKARQKLLKLLPQELLPTPKDDGNDS